MLMMSKVMVDENTEMTEMMMMMMMMISVVISWIILMVWNVL